MAPTTNQVGWIGLGSMGLAMASNVQRYFQREGKPALNIWNRTASRGTPLIALGAVACDSIASLVAGCDLIFISTSDDAALVSIVDQILDVSNLDKKIVVDTTTVHPNTTRQTSNRLKGRGASFIAAPVFGATPAAESGSVLMAMGGPSDAVATVAPFGKGVIARDVMVVSDQPEKASMLKTLGNFIVAGTMEIIGEAQVLAEKSDLGTDTLERLLELNFPGVAHSSSVRMTQGQSPWSSLELGIKDVQHGITSAENSRTRLKVAEVALENMMRAKAFSEAHGDRPLDSSSGYGTIRQDAGLDFESPFVKERDA
ncbi:unnamed protein product [Penicillium salamii]|uniref:6-phosphogluconate dehydrogenase NADP-binding domain-containing protein n=1 Tax=Penicillium salamii TaxID=1612424 RepID=A0A9W4K478_9EURO|nr:unnamed protein product [Penicillium salamii]